MLLITVFALPVSCGREAGSTRNGDLDRVCPLRARARVPTARAECPILERMFGPLVEQAPEQCPNAHPWGPNKCARRVDALPLPPACARSSDVHLQGL